MHEATHGGTDRIGQYLEVCGVIPLQALDILDSQLSSQIGVLPICLTPAAPPRISENVDVGGEHAQKPAVQ